MGFHFTVLAACQVAWVIGSIRWYLRRSDEVPLVLAALSLYSMSYRYWVVQRGFAHWVSLGFSGYAEITDAYALQGLAAVVMGQTILLGVYMWRQRARFLEARGHFSSKISDWMKKWVIAGTIAYLPALLYVKHYVASNLAVGKSMAFEMSAYVYQLPYMGTGFAILLLLVWRYANWKNNLRALPLVLAFVLMCLLYGSHDRFKLIATLVGGAIVLGAYYRPKLRLVWLIPGVVVAAVIFSIGGATRDTMEGDVIKEAAWLRFRSAHDANFLDGFVFAMQGAERFGYRYGGEHLEVLYRPIPRALWKGKPIGNHQTRAMGQDTDQHGETIGISPSIFGSFYTEGGYVGIVLLSALYGAGLAYLVGKIAKLSPALAAITRGGLCGWLVSLFRGGDIAGIVAWAFMSFWPLGFFLYIWRHEIRAGKDWVPIGRRRRKRPRGRTVPVMEPNREPALAMDRAEARE